MMSPTDFEHALHGFERAERLEAEAADRDAESARDDLASMAEDWPMGAPELEEHQHRQRIQSAENRAKQCRRRADHAAAGYLLVTDRERADVDWMGRNQALVSAAHRAGRVKGTS